MVEEALLAFDDEVSSHLKYYVYRLIDPRNGETFYVGKGKDNRVFTHANGKQNGKIEEPSEKLQRIRQIQNSGFHVEHIIHRHGLEQREAEEVEAALIDAYPATANLVGGRDSGDRGVMHARQIIERFRAKEAEFRHPCVLITVNRTADEQDLYEAVRYAWVIDRKKARGRLVLAVKKGLILDAFEVDGDWLPATPENFPGRADYPEGRYGFIGRLASDQIRELYTRRRVPDSMRKRGAVFPIRYAG